MQTIISIMQTVSEYDINLPQLYRSLRMDQRLLLEVVADKIFSRFRAGVYLEIPILSLMTVSKAQQDLVWLIDSPLVLVLVRMHKRLSGPSQKAAAVDGLWTCGDDNKTDTAVICCWYEGPQARKRLITPTVDRISC
jgi:hypothetical protein